MNNDGEIEQAAMRIRRDNFEQEMHDRGFGDIFSWTDSPRHDVARRLSAVHTELASSLLAETRETAIEMVRAVLLPNKYTKLVPPPPRSIDAILSSDPVHVPDVPVTLRKHSMRDLEDENRSDISDEEIGDGPTEDNDSEENDGAKDKPRQFKCSACGAWKPTARSGCPNKNCVKHRGESVPAREKIHEQRKANAKRTNTDIDLRLHFRKKQIADRVRAIIKNRNETLAEIEKRTGIKLAYLSRIQKEDANLTLESICRLELALDREIISVSNSEISLSELTNTCQCGLCGTPKPMRNSPCPNKRCARSELKPNMSTAKPVAAGTPARMREPGGSLLEQLRAKKVRYETLAESIGTLIEEMESDD